jgi:hypothetical protein
MSKGHQRSNREMKKPKQAKAAAPVAGASPFTTPSGAKTAQPTRTPGGKKIPGYMR